MYSNNAYDSSFLTEGNNGLGEICKDCGFEVGVSKDCLATGKPHGIGVDVVCQDCGGLTEQTAARLKHEKLKHVARIHHVQRELQLLASSPEPTQVQDSQNSMWPVIAKLEREKIALVAKARRIGFNVPSHQTPPSSWNRFPVQEEIAALNQFNQDLKRLIEAHGESLPEVVGSPSPQRRYSGYSSIL
eukprot:TRINITY_DN5185_c0_g1_i1.p1 TRINITY_DN5185_c0_g1~~TRINITY_DN5185_c0_g1_i1.p1  ORF type:complete len:188 (+),score=44.99 TRINITY_DN5185_c0_g1_i1:41-604(+)